MFMGRYEHSVDEKSRITIPARYRELLTDSAFITQGFDKNLLVLTQASFDEISQRVKQMSITDDDARLLKRLIFSNAERVEVDRAGRILIPQWLRTYANIGSNAIIVGVGEYFEIWSPELWALQNEKLQDSDANAQRFGDLNLPV